MPILSAAATAKRHPHLSALMTPKKCPGNRKLAPVAHSAIAYNFCFLLSRRSEAGFLLPILFTCFPCGHDLPLDPQQIQDGFIAGVR